MKMTVQRRLVTWGSTIIAHIVMLVVMMDATSHGGKPEGEAKPLVFILVAPPPVETPTIAAPPPPLPAAPPQPQPPPEPPAPVPPPPPSVSTPVETEAPPVPMAEPVPTPSAIPAANPASPSPETSARSNPAANTPAPTSPPTTAANTIVAGPIQIGEPSYLVLMQPEYPTQARRLHQEGTVVLALSLDSEGKLEKVVVTKSSGHPLLDQAAVEAMQQSRFQAANQNGVPVPSRAEVSITFRLEN